MHLYHIYFDKITNIFTVNESNIIKNENYNHHQEINVFRYNLHDFEYLFL
jgi:hypothetical protein